MNDDSKKGRVIGINLRPGAEFHGTNVGIIDVDVGINDMGGKSFLDGVSIQARQIGIDAYGLIVAKNLRIKGVDASNLEQVGADAVARAAADILPSQDAALVAEVLAEQKKFGDDTQGFLDWVEKTAAFRGAKVIGAAKTIYDIAAALIAVAYSGG